jgi:transcriptional regulator with XRE-family HTH domain
MTRHVMARIGDNFGQRLKWWREHRGVSQLDLAGIAGSSQRHVSFLESGRTLPSRDMVLRLGAALDVPLRQQNALLIGAGYAPVWRETDLNAPELAKVRAALDHMLAQQEPYPAFVVDRRWTLLRANDGARRMLGFLTGASAPPPADAPPLNLAHGLISPDGLRPLIVNWEEVASYFLRSVQSDAIADGTRETAALLEALLAYPGVPMLPQLVERDEPAAPVLVIHFRKGETSLHLFTTIATLGTPRDVTLQEIRIECFFPADEDTGRIFCEWAAKPPRS